MPPVGYVFTCVMAVFSILLLGWDGFQSYSSGWVFGFLAVIWSLMMMMRLMTLTASYEQKSNTPHNLAQKIVRHLYERREERHNLILMKSLGGSFALFFVGLVCFLAWQALSGFFPSQKIFIDGFAASLLSFRYDGAWLFQSVHDWGQIFMLSLSLAMMAFVLRSHADNKTLTRGLMIVVSSYAVAGLITFAGIALNGDVALGQNTLSPGIMGNGAGTGLWLSSALYGDAAPNVFEIILIETGAAGLGIVVFMVFVPLGSITLGAQHVQTDSLVLSCAMIIAICLILSVFLPFVPALGAYMFLCVIGIFMAWGAAEVGIYTPASVKA